MYRIELALIAALSLAAPVATAQEYPAKPVALMVPFAAGGPTDTSRVASRKQWESI
ncbi:MAG: hypothetical protein WKH97_02670 [Casimicrobiaceae bacterium]